MKSTPSLLLTALIAVLVPPGAVAWEHKVEPGVLEAAAAGESTELLVYLAEQADLSPARRLATKLEKGRFVHRRLTEVARRSQGPVLAALEELGVEHRPYWIVNMVWVRGGIGTVEAMARRPEVVAIHANPGVALERPVERRAGAAPEAIEPNLEQVGAPHFWDAGFTGQGVVVAHGDTGVDWDHPALLAQYRGWDGAVADHDHNWHDAIHSGGGDCGADSPEPCDDDDHGTHTMGIMVGDDGAGNQIGMAPGARWISCRNMDQGVGTPTTYTECFQFFLAPTDLAGEDPRPELAPDVVSNSWRCPVEEGCTDPTVLQQAVESLRAAGIIVVASAGNTGSACFSVADPPAIYDAAWTVGAVNIEGEIMQFSSRGPVAVDDSYRLKPDLVAPGHDIRSSVRGGGYLFFSGTSMSGPHVAGLAALMISADECFRSETDSLELYLKSHTTSFPSGEVCGDVPGGQSPNNTYGYGIIRAVLPAPGDCSRLLSGTATGVGAGRGSCRNATSGVSGSVLLDAAGFWDCADAGVAADPADLLLLNVRAEAGLGEVAGSVTGMTVQSVTCRNLTQGESVTILDATAWNCTAAGLPADPGDLIRMQVRGRAE